MLPNGRFDVRRDYLSEQEPEILAELIALYGEYGESLGIIDMPADFNPLAALAGNE